MRYAICIDNTGYAASLELRKLYQVLDDAFAETHEMIRVIDESGEDYLYATSRFLRVTDSNDMSDDELLAAADEILLDYEAREKK